MRLFIAVNIPDELRAKIWDGAAPLRNHGDGIRWVAPVGMHVTLKFLGEVSKDREESIGRSLEGAADGVAPFTFRIEGFGAFPDARRPRVFWVGCESGPAIQRLHRQVEENMAAIGFPPETRSFSPHVTLGRVRRHVDKNQLRGLRGRLERLEFAGEFLVPTVELMQSELTSEGANYTVRKSVELHK